MKREERIERTKKIITRRMNQITEKSKGPGMYTRKDVEQPHRLAKKPAFGCRRGNCKICRKKR